MTSEERQAKYNELTESLERLNLCDGDAVVIRADLEVTLDPDEFGFSIPQQMLDAVSGQTFIFSEEYDEHNAHDMPYGYIARDSELRCALIVHGNSQNAWWISAPMIERVGHEYVLEEIDLLFQSED